MIKQNEKSAAGGGRWSAVSGLGATAASEEEEEEEERTTNGINAAHAPSHCSPS